MSGLVRDIIERPSAVASSSSAALPPKPPTLSQSNGFPAVTHRSLKPPSAFIKARQERERQAQLKASGKLPQDGKVPVIKAAEDFERPAGDVDPDEKQNLDRVRAMGPEEREQEKAELLDRFGANLIGIMQKRRDKREKGLSKVIETAAPGPKLADESIEPITNIDMDAAQNFERVDAMSAEEREQEKAELLERFGGSLTDLMSRRKQAREGGASQTGEPTHSPPVTNTSAEPPQQTATPRQVRFAEEAQPQPYPSIDPSVPLPEDEDPFSPAYIHKTYFPTTRHDASKLEWLQPPSAASSAPEDTTVRFDLSGQALDPLQAANLPAHLGLHHHGSSPDLAGYTLKDIYHLCLSTVPSQRITMFDVLAKIVGRYMLGELTAAAKEECVREEITSKAVELATGVLAGLEKNSNVIRVAVGLLFEAVGGSTWASPDNDWLNEMSDRENPAFTLCGPSDSTDLLAGIPFEALISRFSRLLALNQPDISALTTHQLLRILRRASIHSQQIADTICPLIPVAVSTHLMGATNAQLDALPSLETLLLLRDITISSRACAEALIAQNTYEPLIRFIASFITSTAAPDEDHELRTDLSIQVLHVFAALGRYGLMASITATGAEIWRDLGAYVGQSLSSGTAEAVTEAYLEACKVWIICSIDPHRIVPDHDVTWTQVTAMGWGDEALDVVDATIGSRDRMLATAAALKLIAAWLRGAKINEPASGKSQKDLVRACSQQWDLPSVLRHALASGRLRVAAAILELWETFNEVTGLDNELRQLLRSTLSALLKSSQPPQAEAVGSNKPATMLALAILRTLRRLEAFTTLEWTEQSSRVMLQFIPGDEPLALDLLDDFLKTDWSHAGLEDHISNIGYKDGLNLLRPLLQHTIFPDITQLVGPATPNPIYLKNTSTLRLPATLERIVLSAEQSSGHPAPVVGLPLARDWMYSPLNELLQSGTSQSLTQVPPGWDASEVEITRATLVFAQLTQSSLDDPENRSLRLLNLMKVFMLEHGQQTNPNPHVTEVFRDAAVSSILSTHIAPLLAGNSPAVVSTPGDPTLEKVSLTFLGSGVPFFQFYVDFLALFEAISLSDTVFTQLLLPVLAQRYPVDYRKLVWCDQPTSLRSIRLRVEDVPLETGRIEDYFYPLEVHADALAGYTRALINRWISKPTHPFLYLLAIHHISGILWSTDADQVAVRDSLLKALFHSAPAAVLLDLLQYQQQEGKVEIAPAPALDKVQEARRGLVRSIAGERALQRLESP